MPPTEAQQTPQSSTPDISLDKSQPSTSDTASDFRDKLSKDFTPLSQTPLESKQIHSSRQNDLRLDSQSHAAVYETLNTLSSPSERMVRDVHGNTLPLFFPLLAEFNQLLVANTHGSASSWKAVAEAGPPPYLSPVESARWRQEVAELCGVDKAVDDFKGMFHKFYVSGLGEKTVTPKDTNIGLLNSMSGLSSLSVKLGWFENLTSAIIRDLRSRLNHKAHHWNECQPVQNLIYDFPCNPRIVAIRAIRNEVRKRKGKVDNGKNEKVEPVPLSFQAGNFMGSHVGEAVQKLYTLPHRASISDVRNVLDGACDRLFDKELEHSIENHAQMLAAVALQGVVDSILNNSDVDGASASHVVRRIGDNVFYQGRKEALLEEAYEKGMAGIMWATVATTLQRKINHMGTRDVVYEEWRNKYRAVMPDSVDQADDGSSAAGVQILDSAQIGPKWSSAERIRVGAYLVDTMLNETTSSGFDKHFPEPENGWKRHIWTEEFFRERGNEDEAAFRRVLVRRNDNGRTLTIGRILMHPNILSFMVKGGPDSYLRQLPLDIEVPLLAPPVAWSKAVGHVPYGAFMHNSCKFMRTNSALAVRRLKEADPESLQTVFDGLNACGATRWIINERILGVAKLLWNVREDGARVIPCRDPESLPQVGNYEELGPQLYFQQKQERAEALKRNAENHALRCSFQLALSVADEFKKERAFYFAYNIDFRGRAYPLSPYLSPTGDDLARGLLAFAEPKKLGERGLFWLRVHLANLYGFDKASMEERAEWTRKRESSGMIAAIDASPLEGKNLSYWLSADKPFQFLAVCQELAEALRSDDPTEFQSRMPVHQDGSCNGLQHYSALGRDEIGGRQVNLTHCDKRGDVYEGVCEKVREKMADYCEQLDDRRMEVEELHLKNDPIICDTDKYREKVRKLREAEMASELTGLVGRKTIKQTVMTSVYGVTALGAKDQVFRRLKETPELSDKSLKELNEYASFLSKLTLKSLGEVVSGATKSMKWLKDIARLVAQTNRPLEWTTPLGLPVVQPYHKAKTTKVRTVLQSITFRDKHGSQDNIDTQRQRNGIAPNFVHSLDSSHMLLTASACHKRSIVFAAVHDSFWTHAKDVDDMSQIIRETFVDLHSPDIFRIQLEEWRRLYPEVAHDFPDPPERGNLDIEQVKKSSFFFS